MQILQLFFDCDEFCREFLPRLAAQQLPDGKRHRKSESSLSPSEVMTIVILFHHSGFRSFKSYYTLHVCQHWRAEFPHLVSYQRMVELKSSVLVPLAAFFHSRFGNCSGISFVDATSIAICHNRRINSNKVFRGVAKRGKTSVGWFYGFKVHLVINGCGELLGAIITPGNVDDRKPVPKLSQRLFGKLFGDRGYVSQPLFNLLYQQGVQLITKLKKNMKNKLMPVLDQILLRKRALIETVNDQLKNICQIEHTRHRSVANFIVNLITALIAYTYQEKKPSLHLRHDHLAALSPAIF
ncbi:MAG: IS982 family transposase [Oligoflexales bacterium]